MILKAPTLENFKGICQPVRIEPAPLTLLFGPNYAGKSTILKALQFTAALPKARGRDPFDVSAAEGMDLGRASRDLPRHASCRWCGCACLATLSGLYVLPPGRPHRTHYDD